LLWGNTAYCVKLRGENLSRYWNNIESVGLNVRIITALLRKWCHNNKHFSELAPTSRRKKTAAALIRYDETTSLSPYLCRPTAQREMHNVCYGKLTGLVNRTEKTAGKLVKRSKK